MTSDTCNFCYTKFCKNSQKGEFEICQYGVSYLNKGDSIISKEPKIPLSTIAKNLRHEINPILQSIIEQTSIIDPTLSTKIIDLNKPLSIIIGNTVILDHFIQMITGVHEFHSTPSNISHKQLNLKNIIYFYYYVYSILKEDGRNEILSIEENVPKNLFIEEYSDFIKYMISILIDNAWKYSLKNSFLKINLTINPNGLYDLELTNTSTIIPDDIDIFKVGVKKDEKSKGFGYGLYWIQNLKDSYNELIKKDKKLDIIHKQIITGKNESMQSFTIHNLNLVKI